MSSESNTPHSALWRHPEFAQGAKDLAVVSLGISAWGLVTGVAMSQSGMGVPLALLMSLVVFAGSAQLATIPLLASGAPLWVIWATAACVNLRFVLFSASWRPYVGGLPLSQRLGMSYFCADMNHVMFMRRFPEPRPQLDRQLPYFWGGVTCTWFMWQVPSVVGILLADRFPTQWGVGFAGILALLGLAYSLLADRAAWVAAVVAGAAAVAAYALPLKLNIVVAIAAAVAVGVLMDHAAPRTAESNRGSA